MIPQSFEYTAPRSIDEALKLLAAGAKPLAGGMSLIPMMKLRLAAPEHLVDLARIKDLNYIRQEGGHLHIGATATHHAIAGYSLGGLSAMDICWNHPEVFTKVGVFSGSFWWRKRDTKSLFYSDHRDRLMHQQVRKGKFKAGLKFWFQTGTLDEWGDRNENGIIDSIDDTLDLITELTKKGYRPFQDIEYLEIEAGKHHPETWAEALPVFLTWAFKNSNSK